MDATSHACAGIRVLFVWDSGSAEHVWVTCPVCAGQLVDTFVVYGSGLCSVPNLYSAMYGWKLVCGIPQVVNVKFPQYHCIKCHLS